MLLSSHSKYYSIELNCATKMLLICMYTFLVRDSMCLFHSSNIHACRCVPRSLKLSDWKFFFSAQCFLLFSFHFAIQFMLCILTIQIVRRHTVKKSQFFCYFFSSKKSFFSVVLEEKELERKKL